VESKNPAKATDRTIRPINRQLLTIDPPASGFTLPQLRERSRAFTLIELLVVITIIIILMAFLFPAFRGVQDQAKRAQAKNDLTQMVTAVNAYYTEYGKYPVPGAATSTPDDFWITDVNNADIFNVMRADGFSWDSTSGQNLNPRRVVFMQIPYAKDATQPRSGICPSGANAGKYYDPWGNTYRLRIDWDYNNNLVNPYTSGAGASPLSLGVIAYSIGRDNQSDADTNTGKYKVSGQTSNGDDDVLSWQ
jgi:prepilin-type N-terminal cleavage/methylation domain-containing protein